MGILLMTGLIPRIFPGFFYPEFTHNFLQNAHKKQKGFLIAGCGIIWGKSGSFN